MPKSKPSELAIRAAQKILEHCAVSPADQAAQMFRFPEFLAAIIDEELAPTLDALANVTGELPSSSVNAAEQAPPEPRKVPYSQFRKVDKEPEPSSEPAEVRACRHLGAGAEVLTGIGLWKEAGVAYFLMSHVSGPDYMQMQSHQSEDGDVLSVEFRKSGRNTPL